MKKQNDEILAKLNSIEEDNRKLRQELLEIKSLQKHCDVKSRKRDEQEGEVEHENEQSNSNKKAKISVASSLPEPLASLDILDDDCLGNVLEFVGEKCYSVFGRVNKRFHETFCSKGLPKKTYLYGYGSIHLILQQRGRGWFSGLSKGVFQYNRRDILEWMMKDISRAGYWRLKCLCWDAIEGSRLDILHEVFQRTNGNQLEYLRNCDICIDLCSKAAQHGKLEILKILRENECDWNRLTWYHAKREEHEHVLEYMRKNGFQV